MSSYASWAIADEAINKDSSRSFFESELAEVLNRFSKENESNTPDCVLAKFLINCLNAYSQAIKKKQEALEIIANDKSLSFVVQQIAKRAL